MSTEPADFAEFGAHRAPYETAIEASGTDSYSISLSVQIRREEATPGAVTGSRCMLVFSVCSVILW